MKKFALVVLAVLVFALLLVGCNEVTSLSFAVESYTIKTGTGFAPEVKVRPKNAGYTLASSNNAIAYADGTIIMGLKEGVVTVTATAGNKTATCTVYITDSEVAPSPGGTIVDGYVVNFIIANYEEVGLSTGFLQAIMVREGGGVSINDPYLSGYDADCWYTDEACTEKFDLDTPITENITLYARFVPRQTAFGFSGGFVTGLLYPNLPHEEITLPEGSDGNVIYGIASNAFKGDETIKKVNIPASYRFIDDSAFAGCTNLKEVNIPSDSRLERLGINAFGAITDSENNISGTCNSLETLNLPDTVTEIGEFCFYKCTSLKITVPSSLYVLQRYAFSGTKIKSASLKNVTAVYEGAFADCAELETVTDTENVTRCERNAFSGTKLESDAFSAADKALITAGNEDSAAYYAGTILFGCYPYFGRGKGNGKLHIKEETTLIADCAFAGEDLDDRYLSDLTIYIDTEIANSAINRMFLGENVFKDSDGVFVVVGSGLINAYAERYNAGNRNYSRLFAEETVKTIAGNKDTPSWGTHILLRRFGSYSYYYDRFIPDESGAPFTVDLGGLGILYDVTRVNLCAFAGIAGLRMIDLANVKSLAPYAITNCPAMRRIDASSAVSVITPEDANSISNCPNAKVNVKSADLVAYRNIWGKYSNLSAMLEAV